MALAPLLFPDQPAVDDAMRVRGDSEPIPEWTSVPRDFFFLFPLTIRWVFLRPPPSANGGWSYTRLSGAELLKRHVFVPVDRLQRSPHQVLRESHLHELLHLQIPGNGASEIAARGPIWPGETGPRTFSSVPVLSFFAKASVQ